MIQKTESTDLRGTEGVPIADALDVVGERWSLLVVRELGFGVRRFNDIQVDADPETLALRLRRLEEAGVIERRRYCDHPPRDEYVLTPDGEALMPSDTGIAEVGRALQHSGRRRPLVHETADQRCVGGRRRLSRQKREVGR